MSHLLGSDREGDYLDEKNEDFSKEDFDSASFTSSQFSGCEDREEYLSLCLFRLL